MRTILVDDEAIMIRSFLRLSAGLEELEIVGQFQYAEDALEYMKNNTVDLAILDIEMPGMNGIELGKKLREIRPELILVFITAYDDYIRQSIEINADAYLLKPYSREVMEQMAARVALLAQRQKKSIYVQMFGRFNVFKDGVPVRLGGHAKEILALVATRRGKEISNEEIYTTIWENREYNNVQMKVYYNALKRLKSALEEAGIPQLLQSTSRGQIFNVAMVDCDYYSWLEKDRDTRTEFEGEFLSEYSWGEYILGGMYE